MEKHGKIWGETSKIFSKNNVEICRIVGIQGGKSSTHKHASKWSMFFVEQGKILITIEKNDYDLIDKTVLGKSESIVVKPEEFHCFEILEENTICYEVYWTEINENDIIRKNCGSIQNLKP